MSQTSNVLDMEGRIVPVQVTWEGHTGRHERALEEFYGEFPDAAQPLVVTADSLEAMLKFACRDAGWRLRRITLFRADCGRAPRCGERGLR